MNRQQKRQLLQEWRGVEEPPPERKQAVAVGEVLPALLKKLGLKDRYDEEEIGRVWTEIVGYPLCVEAVPAGFQNGVVHIRVMQATARYAMELDRVRVLKALQERLGKRIRDLRILRG